MNNPGSWSHIYAPLRHAEWHGWTPTDLIFPFFLFIVGVAIPFSFGKRLARGDSRQGLLRHVLRRSLILFVLGLFMAAYPRFDLGNLRIMGVLQRIGLVYLLAASVFLFVGRRGRVWIAAGLLFGYWALLTLVPVPGFGPGDLSPDGNLGAYLDRLILGDRLWRGTWDPEGLLSTLPAVATTLLGIFTGEWLRSERTPEAKVGGLLAGGVAGIGLGLFWGLSFPINKAALDQLLCPVHGRSRPGLAGLLLLGDGGQEPSGLGQTVRRLWDERHRRFRRLGIGGEANGTDEGRTP